tara:strand:+ start:166 stop:648 length:483 start_codon:yes stop_codon:yes gene_type:complete
MTIQHQLGRIKSTMTKAVTEDKIKPLQDQRKPIAERIKYWEAQIKDAKTTVAAIDKHLKIRKKDLKDDIERIAKIQKMAKEHDFLDIDVNENEWGDRYMQRNPEFEVWSKDYMTDGSTTPLEGDPRVDGHSCDSLRSAIDACETYIEHHQEKDMNNVVGR